MDDLRSDDLSVKMRALEELVESIRGEGVGREVVEPLNDLLLDDSPEIRKKATWALGRLAMSKIGEGSSVPLLNTLTMDHDGEVRENAAWSLGELAGAGVGDRTSLPLLTRLLGDHLPEVRGMAAWSLGRLAEKMGLVDRASLDNLQQMLEQETGYLQKGAKWAVERVHRALER